MKKIILFGASGNIGQKVLEIIKHDPSYILVAFSVGLKDYLVEDILNDFKFVKIVYAINIKKHWQIKYPHILFVNDDICKLFDVDTNCVINALSGFVGFKVTIKALQQKKLLLNANKESFVVGGNLINDLQSKYKTKIYPIDSEHCAIWQCLEKNNNIKEIYITASGGPFKDLSLKETQNVTLNDALKHPTWNMGQKITIDSATMFNKAFEIIEAFHLFKTNKIKTLIHPQSIIHSMVLFEDNAIKAQLSVPDMHQVINYFLTYPKRVPLKQQQQLNFKNQISLDLQEIDQKRFLPVAMAMECLNEYNTKPIAMNAANEICVAAFLEKKISFFSITKIVYEIFQTVKNEKLSTYNEIYEFDQDIRKKTLQKIKGVG